MITRCGLLVLGEYPASQLPEALSAHCDAERSYWVLGGRLGYVLPAVCVPAYPGDLACGERDDDTEPRAGWYARLRRTDLDMDALHAVAENRAAFVWELAKKRVPGNSPSALRLRAENFNLPADITYHDFVGRQKAIPVDWLVRDSIAVPVTPRLLTDTLAALPPETLVSAYEAMLVDPA